MALHQVYYTIYCHCAVPVKMGWPSREMKIEKNKEKKRREEEYIIPYRKTFISGQNRIPYIEAHTNFMTTINKRIIQSIFFLILLFSHLFIAVNRTDPREVEGIRGRG